MVGMNRPTKVTLVGVGVVGVLILQAVATFAAYGHRLGFEIILALTLPVAFVLQVMLFSRARALIAVASATVLTLVGACVGVCSAIRTYGS